MISKLAFAAFVKEAIRIPVVHGTNAEHEFLGSHVGEKVNPTDPNPKGLYVATKNRQMEKGVGSFARAASKARGGSPVVAHAKIDTSKGWRPHALTKWGRENLGGLEDAMNLVHELDAGGLSRVERGQLWQDLQRGVGAWTHAPGAPTSLRPHRYARLLK